LINYGKLPFKCRDIGMDCDFATSSKSNDDLFMKISDHAKAAHNIEEISPELKQKITGVIRKKLF
jgi:Predicted small metal-binding protein